MFRMLRSTSFDDGIDQAAATALRIPDARTVEEKQEEAAGGALRRANGKTVMDMKWWANTVMGEGR